MLSPAQPKQVEDARGAGDMRQGYRRHRRDPKVLQGRVGECEGKAWGPDNGAVALALAGELRQCRACVCRLSHRRTSFPFKSPSTSSLLFLCLLYSPNVNCMCSPQWSLVSSQPPRQRRRDPFAILNTSGTFVLQVFILDAVPDSSWKVTCGDAG